MRIPLYFVSIEVALIQNSVCTNCLFICFAFVASNENTVSDAHSTFQYVYLVQGFDLNRICGRLFHVTRRLE